MQGTRYRFSTGDLTDGGRRPAKKWARRWRLDLLSIGLLGLFLLPVDGYGELVINEIMYSPYQPFGVTNETEYVELYNAGTSTVDLAVYRFDNGVSFTFPQGATLPAGAYAVVCENVVAFQDAHPGVTTNVYGDFSGSLRNSGERITLSQLIGNSWETADTISYAKIGESGGGGPSLELVHPGFARLGNYCYGSWAVSASSGGTPGQQNSRYDATPPPVVGDPTHNPPLPPEGSSVTFSCRAAAYDSDVLGHVRLRYRVTATPELTWKEATMEDLGINGDLVARDGVYSVRIPPYGEPTYPAGAVVEFKIEVTDNYAQSMTAPATNTTINEFGPPPPPYSYLLKFGEDTAYTGEYDTYHILMTDANRTTLETRPVTDDHLIDATLITSDGQVFYNAGVRYRGGSSRAQKLNYRIELPASREYETYSELNLNHYNALNQYMGHELANRMGFGVKGQEVELSRVWLNSVNKSALTTHGIHCRIEGFDGHIIGRYYGDNDWGNRYKSDGDGIYNGDLSYTATLSEYEQNTTGSANYNYISTINNPPEAFVDIQDLCRTVNLPANQLPATMPNRVNVRAWARVYALQVCLANDEPGWFRPYAPSGDELRLYSNPVTGLFDVFPWDMDSMLERSDSGVWAWNLGQVRNFLFHPPVAPYYIGDVLDLLDTTLGNTAMNAFWDSMGSALANRPATRANWQANLNTLRANLKAVISTSLTVSASGTTATGPLATIVNTSPVTLSGAFPQNYTAAVRVNNVDAGWTSWNVGAMQTEYGKWSTAQNGTGLTLPANSVTPVIVEAVDSEGRTLKSVPLTLVRRTTATAKSGTISTAQTWDGATNGIIEVTGALQISGGATVTVASDTIVLMAAGASISVLNGVLAFEGSPDSPAWVLPSNGSSTWSLTASGASSSITASNAVFAGGTLSVTAGAAIDLTDCTVRDSNNALGILQTSSGCDATLVRCIVSDYAKTTFSGTTLIRDCLFRNTGTTGIELTGGAATIDSTTVRGTAALSPATGIRVSGGTAVVTNGLVNAIPGNAIHATGAGTDLTLTGTLLHGCGTGLLIDSPAVARTINNTITTCALGLSGNFSVTNAIVWGNTNGFTTTSGTVAYSDIQRAITNIWTGTGNLNRNPRFLDAGALDFRLQSISPCEGSGSGGVNMGCPFPTGANPAAPSGLALAGSATGTTNRVTVSWTDNSDDEEQFVIERCTEDGPWSQLGAAAAHATGYLDETVVGNVRYSYRVRAVHARGESLYSEVATIVTSPEAYTQTLIDNLRITEIMYNPTNNPPEVNDLEEFIELKNISTSLQLDLGGMYLDNDRHRFPENASSLLDPQEFYVIARNGEAFSNRYGSANATFAVDDKLSNSGETLWIRDALGNKVIEVDYDNDWYPTTDDQGYSLVTVDQNPLNPSNTTTESYWRASTDPGGSPGRDDPDPGYGNIVINELLTHTDAPLEDAVELYNAGTTGVDIAGWFLSDSQSDLTKYQIPGVPLVIPAGGYHVFYEGNSFNASPGAPDQFELSSLGDSLYLSSSDGTNLTGFRTSVSVGAADNGVSFGRHTRSDGVVDFVSMSEHTFGVDNPTSVSQFRTGAGLTNAAPLIGPVVINEIMYNPSAGGKEFVELLNRTGAPVALFDAENPTNTWLFNGAMEYTFPTGITLSEGEIVLLTGTEPALFREVTGLTNATLRIFGPYTGDLDNAGDSVKLYYPDKPETNGFVPYILSDRVKYEDVAPWPELADNGGPSLERIDPDAYGNDPANWAANTLGGTPLGTNNTAAAPVASFTVTTSSILESDGTAALAVRVFPTPTEAQGPVTVHYAVTGGTAGQPGDYSLAAGALLFWPNDGEKSILVSIAADGIAPEPDETVEVSLTAVSGTALLGGNRIHTLTIRDTDIGTVPPPQILPVGGAFYKSISVVLTTATENASIYYTLDGTDPRRDTQLVAGGYRPSDTATLYTSPLTVTTSARVKACTFVGRYNASALTSALYSEKTPMYEYPPGTIALQISQGSDDAEESNGLTVRVNDPQVLIGRSASYVMEYGGLRFSDVALPRGVDVTNAYVQFTSAAAGVSDITISIYAQSADDAPTFNPAVLGDIRPTTDLGGGYIVGWRGRTTGVTTWQPPEWTGANMAGLAQRTPNISEVIQEIVARPGWSSGNAIVLLLTYSYNKFPTAPPYTSRPAKTYETSPEKSAVLFVQYDPDSGGPNPDADDDGMPDEWETGYFGSANAVNGGPTDDWDHDGADNLSEYIADTIPTNSESLFVAVEVSSDGSGNTIRWPSVTTRLYSVWRVADLINQSMDPLQSNIAGHISGTNTYTDGANTNGHVFYRLKVAVPE